MSCHQRRIQIQRIDVCNEPSEEKKFFQQIVI